MARREDAFPRRGEVWLTSFDPTIGAEMHKTHPAVIIQNDVGNRFSPIVIVAAMTSRFDESIYPTEVLVEPPESGLSVASVVQLNQIRSDRQTEPGPPAWRARWGDRPARGWCAEDLSSAGH